jgi:hypothetical protein
VTGDQGFSTPEFVLAAGLGLVMFVLLANAVVLQYAAGVLRSAADEGARAAAPAGAPLGACPAAAADAVGNLLGGELGDDVTVSCVRDGDFIRAEVAGVFRWWVAGIPDWSFRAVALHRAEELP